MLHPILGEVGSEMIDVALQHEPVNHVQGCAFELLDQIPPNLNLFHLRCLRPPVCFSQREITVTNEPSERDRTVVPNPTVAVLAGLLGYLLLQFLPGLRFRHSNLEPEKCRPSARNVSDPSSAINGELALPHPLSGAGRAVVRGPYLWPSYEPHAEFIIAGDAFFVAQVDRASRPT